MKNINFQLLNTNSVLAQRTKNTAMAMRAQPSYLHCQKLTLATDSTKTESHARLFLDLVYY